MCMSTKLQRGWEFRVSSDEVVDEASAQEAQRKALFELIRDIVRFTKTNPNCHVHTIRIDPAGVSGDVSVEMINYEY